jgi:hypothetical protein
MLICPDPFESFLSGWHRAADQLAFDLQRGIVTSLWNMLDTMSIAKLHFGLRTPVGVGADASDQYRIEVYNHLSTTLLPGWQVIAM